MATLTLIRSRVSFLIRSRFAYYHLALITLLGVAFLRPIIENVRYPLLTGWDTWNFLALSTLVAKNGGWIPNWDTLQLQPAGRPFLYPPLIPLVLANLSLISGVSLFWLIKLATLVLYPALIGMTMVLGRLIGDRRIVILSAVFILAINQVYVNSLNSLSQITEIIFYLAVLHAIYKRQYAIAAIFYGLTFWTHSFTPLFFGAGLVLYALLRPDERRPILALAGFGAIIGSPWLIRMFIFSEWIRPNIHMDQHTDLRTWIWTIGAEAFPFFVMAGVLGFVLLLDHPLARRLIKNRLPLLLACTTAGLAGISYYPERSITYMAPGVALLLSLVTFQTSIANLRRSLAFILFAMGLVVVYTLEPFNHFVLPPYLIYVVFLIIGLALAGTWILKVNRNAALALLVTVLFIEINRSGQPLPFISWADPALVNSSRMPPDAWDACKWIASYDPGALVAASEPRISNSCNYLGLPTTTGAIMEFSRDGDIQRLDGADYYIVTWRGDRQIRNGFIWQNGNAAIYPANSAELLPYVRQFAQLQQYYGEPNQPPIANAGPDQEVTVLNLVTLDGGGSIDPDNSPNPLSFAWTQTDGPEAVTLNGVTTATPTFTPMVVGSYTFSLVVNDGQDGSAANFVTITVQCGVPLSLAKEVRIPQLECSRDTPGLRLEREDKTGNKVQLFCQNGEFRLYYVPIGGSPRRVGRCPWLGGNNRVAIIYAGTDEENISCFLNTLWISLEPALPAQACTILGWPESACPGPQVLGLDQGIAVPKLDESGVLDWTHYLFDTISSNLTLNYLYSVDGIEGSLGDFRKKGPVLNVDPLVFDPPTNSGPIPVDPTGGAPMTLRQFIPCDLNLDGQCDISDFELQTNALGQCIGDDKYIWLADADRDGCINSNDRSMLFPFIFFPFISR